MYLPVHRIQVTIDLNDGFLYLPVSKNLKHNDNGTKFGTGAWLYSGKQTPENLHSVVQSFRVCW